MPTVQVSANRVKSAPCHHEHIEADCLADWHAARAMARKLVDKPDLHLLALRVIRYLNPCKHSKDYASITWYGQSFTFTGMQAAFIRELWRAKNRGTPALRQETIFDAIGCDSDRSMGIFKDKISEIAFRTLIISPRRGVYMLAFMEYDPVFAPDGDAREIARRLLVKYADKPVSLALQRIACRVPEDVFVPNCIQEAILAALNGKALRSDALAHKAGYSKGNIYREPGGLPELQRRGLVSHHKRLGYFRPDALPPELS